MDEPSGKILDGTLVKTKSDRIRDRQLVLMESL
jgi:hypothetical protein